jgi:hypothetical protein
MSRWIVALALIASMSSAASAQPAEPPAEPPAASPAAPEAPVSPFPAPDPKNPGQALRWRIELGRPDSDDSTDGKHIQLGWERLYDGAAAKLLIFRRPVLAGETPHEGIGRPDITAPATFGAEFTAGNLSTQDVLAPTPHLGAPVPLAGTILAPGAAVGVWTLVTIVDSAAGADHFVDEVEPDTDYVYGLVPATPGADDGTFTGFPEPGVQTWVISAEAAWWNGARWFFLAFIGVTAVAFFVFKRLARTRAKDMFIRRIPGVDAIEDAIGRSTEMGRPVLYVTGTEEIQDIQTMASLLILGHVAEMTAAYDTELKVANLFPLTMVVAEEIVRQGYSNAGRPDAHRPENVMFITSEQFAYAAAINGMILRDRPATNIFLGRFYAESLLLSETGFMVGAVQIAGTAEFTQLPFFIAACDYTLIGEELYATSAYLTREPTLMAQLKAGDVMKVLIMATVVIGVALATLGIYELGPKLIP